MYTLTLILSWHLAGAVAELDNHPMYVDTMGGQIHLTGFKTRTACLNYKYSMPVTLNGAPQPYSVTSRSCTAAKSSAAGTAEEEAAIE